jgi:methyltransferase (TIGR00027 family)
VSEPTAELTGVSKTAVGVARIRAGESARPDRLFDDPYAAAFVAAMPQAYADEVARRRAPGSLGAVLALHVVVRTRFYDDYLIAAAAAGCRQVVLVAAGLDTRAFRLDWPDGVRLFELDLPSVQAFKEPVLAQAGATPRCTRVVVEADLVTDWTARLTAAGFDRDQATAWLVEGLLVYLTGDDAARLLTAIGDLSPAGSRLACERGNAAQALARQSTGAETERELTALWQGGLAEDAATWLDAHGWAIEVHEVATLAADYGRPVAPSGRGGFVTAFRKPRLSCAG